MNNEWPELDDDPIIYGNHKMLTWNEIPLDGSKIYVTERYIDSEGGILGEDKFGYVIAHNNLFLKVKVEYMREYYKAPDGPERYYDWESAADFETGNFPRLTITRAELESSNVDRTEFIAVYAHEYLDDEEEVDANNMNMPLIQGLIASAPDPNILLRRTNGPGLTVSLARSRRQRRRSYRRRRQHQSRMRRRPHQTRSRRRHTRRRRRRRHLF